MSFLPNFKISKILNRGKRPSIHKLTIPHSSTANLSISNIQYSIFHLKRQLPSIDFLGATAYTKLSHACLFSKVNLSMNRLKSKVFNKRALALTLCFAILVSLVATGLSAITPISPTTAQTNPQTTDIFTGQFIPAYYGAAYDPSEAYKQMAGMEVLVFGYDTWGTIINNFAYRTQVKANGSFQAAGLPNASHYGVCVKDNSSFNTFRAPLPEDGMQSSFAYNQSTFTSDAAVRTQSATPEPTTLKDCRVFLTSIKTVDISNHVNVFPLVPYTVLSVIIKDSYSNTDGNSINRPYEIYAQRLSTNLPALTTSGPGPAPEVTTERVQSAVTDPVIRGRSIRYTPKDKTSNSACGSGTIFQAFAPSGIYAITYWRPDTKDIQKQVTYLNFDGSKSLNSNYNGIAIEPVTQDGTNTWEKLSTRCILQPGEYWQTSSGASAIWGSVYKTSSGYRTTLGDSETVNIRLLSSNLTFIDPKTRQCTSSNQAAISSLTYSSYIFASCDSTTKTLQLGSKTITDIQITSGSYEIESSIDSISVNTLDGPSKFSRNLRSSIANQGPDAQLKVNGKALAGKSIDLFVDSRTYKNFTTTDAQGRFNIPLGYISNNPLAKYKIQVYLTEISKFHQVELNRYTNGPITASTTLGAIDIMYQKSPAASLLASLNLQNFFDKFRFPTAYAYDFPTIGEGWKVSGYPFQSSQWVFPVDAGDLSKATQSVFLGSRYDLEHAHITPPASWDAYVSCLASGDDTAEGQRCQAIHEEYKGLLQAYNDADPALNTANRIKSDTKLFIINDREKSFDANSGMKNGYVTSERSDSDADKNYTNAGHGKITEAGTPDSEIIGVSLMPTTEFDFCDSDNADNCVTAIKSLVAYMTAVLGSVNDNDKVPFKLYLKFRNAGDPTVTQRNLENAGLAGEPNDTTGQSDIPRAAEVVTATSDVYLQFAGTETPSGDSAYTVSYSKAVLTTEGDICKNASLWDGITDLSQSLVCKTTQGIFNGITGAFDWLSETFFILDPIQRFSGLTAFWNVSRNIVNSFAVILLVIMGVAIMIRYDTKTYSIQNLIPKLIITIILVNFSVLLIQIAIDITNLIGFGGYKALLNGFYAIHEEAGGDNYMSITNGAKSLGALSAGVLVTVSAMTGGVGLFMGIMLLLLGFAVFFGYILLRIMVDWAIRVATICLCIIGAPLAFAARALPSTQSYYNKWKSALIGALVGHAMMMLIMAVALGMIEIGKGSTEILTFVLAFITFYLASRLPRQAAAAVGTDMTANVEKSLLKGLGSSKKIMSQQIQKTIKDRALSSERKAILEQDSDYQSKTAAGKFLARNGAGVRIDRLKAGYKGKIEGIQDEAFDLAIKEKEAQVKDGEFRNQSRAEKRAHRLNAAEIEVENTGLRHRFPDAEIQQLEDERLEALQKTANYTADAMVGGTFAKARENLSLVNSPYNVTFHRYNPETGEVELDGLMGDMSGDYGKGFQTVMKNVKNTDAVNKLKTQITPDKLKDSRSANAFYESFSYTNKAGAAVAGPDAWKAWYNDIGVSTEGVLASDLKGQTMKMLTVDAANKSQNPTKSAAWGSDLRRVMNQSASGVPDRAILDLTSTDNERYVADTLLTTYTGVHAPADLGPSLPLVYGNPPSNTIMGKESTKIFSALERVRTAYNYVHNTGRQLNHPESPVRPNQYLDAVTILEDAGYQIVSP